MWSVEGKRSDNNGREGRNIKVSCGVKRRRGVTTKEEERVTKSCGESRGRGVMTKEEEQGD